MNFAIHPSVIDFDLPEIALFIARDNPDAAQNVLDAIESTFAQLQERPLSGIIWKPGIRRLAGLRLLPSHFFPNYLIFHRAGPDFVFILYVVHGARDLPAFFAENARF